MASVTCRNEDCPSDGAVVQLALTYADPDTGETRSVDRVVCGACGQQITDIDG